MSKEAQDNHRMHQVPSDAAEAKPTGELSDQDLALVDGGGVQPSLVNGVHIRQILEKKDGEQLTIVR